jgi:phosphatidate cytidylyltransferase
MKEYYFVVIAIAILAIFAIVFCIAGKYQSRAKTTELWQLYRLQILVVSAILFPTFLGGIYLLIVSMLVVIRMLWECFKVYDIDVHNAAAYMAMVCVCLVLTVYYLGFDQSISFLFVCIILMMNVFILLNLGNVKRYITILTIGIVCTIPLIALMHLNQLEQGFDWICLIYLVCVINDTSALVAGKLFGKHHPLPKLSPGKTSEGMLSGIFFSVTAGTMFAVYMLNLPLLTGFYISLGVVICSISGDMGVSILKRSKGIKDFPPVNNHVGGIVDINDAFFLSVVIFSLYTIII